MSVVDNWHAFVLRPTGDIPKKLTFYVTVENVGENESDVPTVTHFSLNNVTLCSDEIKVSKKTSLDINDIARKTICIK
jgi:subtilase family serine protease